MYSKKRANVMAMKHTTETLIKAAAHMKKLKQDTLLHAEQDYVDPDVKEVMKEDADDFGVIAAFLKDGDITNAGTVARGLKTEARDQIPADIYVMMGGEIYAPPMPTLEEVDASIAKFERQLASLLKKKAEIQNQKKHS